jgi:hypothetical protein
MIHSVVIFSILATVLALAGVTQAGTISLSVSSSKPIVHSMDLAVNRGSFTYLYTQGQSRIDSVHEDKSLSDTLKLRNPNTALLLAIVPGFVTHGAGHLYAGKPLTALVLFGLGAVGGRMLIEGSAHLGFFKGFQSSGSETGYTIELLSGLALFMGSWIFDIVRGPQIIEERNERLLYGNKIS